MFSIDPEFRAFIPPLTDDERAKLEASLVAAGRARDPLIVWRGGGEGGADVLLDGHNRYEICTRLGLPFEAEAIDLPDRAAAMAWMFEHQLARRNLSRAQRVALAVLHGLEAPASLEANQARQMAADEDGRRRLGLVVAGKLRSVQAAHSDWGRARGEGKPKRRRRLSIEDAIAATARLSREDKLALAEQLVLEAEASNG
jgi:hypothetical protein